MQSTAPASSGACWWNAQTTYTEFFPFIFRNATATLQPRSVNMFANKDTTRVFLVADGIWAHALDPRRLTLRHGNLKGTQGARACNMVFMDGHAASVPASAMPLVTDNLYDKNILANGNGSWQVRLLAKPLN